jgi:hypothetical protein
MNFSTALELRRRGVAIAAALLLAVAGLAQTLDPASEGYDPMRQISTQFVRPNMLIVLDVSGSMAQDSRTIDVGVDCVGFEWKPSTSTVGCASNKRHYVYELKPNPSRMAVVKNALGNSITIYQWTPPTSFPDFSGQGTTWTYFAPGTYDADPADSTPASPFHTWVSECRNNTASPPFVANQAGITRTAEELVGAPGTVTLVPPADLVGRNASSANFGLVVFASPSGGSPGFSDCQKSTLRAKIDTTDSGDVAVIQAYLKRTDQTTTIAGTTYRGQGLATYTPTRGALNFATTVHRLTAEGGTTTDYQNTSWSFTADPKQSCGRIYATILVTDGLSNRCNPGDTASAPDDSGRGGSWREPCCSSYSSSTPPPCYTDVGSSGYTCPDDYDKFAAQRALEAWDLSAAGRRLNVRTWVIGVSQQVGPCELNAIAYRGRTDASSPEGDAGFDWASDPYLPPNNFDTYASTGCTGHAPPHGHYAYFASTSQELRNAFSAILTSVGAGDYTTSAPSVTPSLVDFGGMVGFVSSASYPKWQGHLYAYDLLADCYNDTAHWDCTQACGWVDPNGSGRKSNCLWDAGEILSLGALNRDGTRKSTNNGLARKLYTWDPASSNALVEIAGTSSATQLDALCGGCGITAAVADFMTGNNGAGAARAWKLGAIVNSTQAVIGPVQVWKQNKLESHTAFEGLYANRHPIVWAGSSDGFIHGFDVIDGAEIVALIPPEQLAKQVQLYGNYIRRPSQFPTGQARAPSEHLYGVANSPRFGDVWFPGASEYKTVLFATQGPGGTGVAGIDVTHPFPAGRDYDNDGETDDIERPDPNYSATAPVTPLWSKNRGNYAALGETWSVPALGATSGTAWQVIMGAGFDGTLADDGTGRPTVYRLDAVDGSADGVETLDPQPTGALVRNQSFADAVVWETGAPYFQADNLVNEGVQVDLNGQLWTLAPNQWSPSSMFNLGAGQPLYYPPAVAAYPAGPGPTHQLYAFGSGTFYERSANVTGRSSTFVPTLYIGVKSRSGGTPLRQGVAIRSIYKPNDETRTLGARTQLTAPPMIFVAKQGSSANPFALFLAYDPEAGTCVGTSYIIKVTFDPDPLGTLTIPAWDVYEAGPGAASGFAIAGERVVVSRSYVGENGRAYLQEVPNLRIPQGGVNGNVSWWLERQ